MKVSNYSTYFPLVSFIVLLKLEHLQKLIWIFISILLVIFFALKTQSIYSFQSRWTQGSAVPPKYRSHQDTRDEMRQGERNGA